MSVCIATIHAYGIAIDVNKERYSDNGRLALRLVEHKSREPFGSASVNIPNAQLAEGELLVKTWSENESIRKPLLDTGLFEDTGCRVPAGFCEAEVWTLKQPL